MKYNLFVEEKHIGEVINNADNNGFKVIKVKKLGHLSKFIEGFKADENMYRVDVKPTNIERFSEAWFTNGMMDLA